VQFNDVPVGDRGSRVVQFNDMPVVYAGRRKREERAGASDNERKKFLIGMVTDRNTYADASVSRKNGLVKSGCHSTGLSIMAL
jgi:hypothetical protein